MFWNLQKFTLYKIVNVLLALEGGHALGEAVARRRGIRMMTTRLPEFISNVCGHFDQIDSNLDTARQSWDCLIFPGNPPICQQSEDYRVYGTMRVIRDLRRRYPRPNASPPQTRLCYFKQLSLEPTQTCSFISCRPYLQHVVLVCEIMILLFL